MFLAEKHIKKPLDTGQILTEEKTPRGLNRKDSKVQTFESNKDILYEGTINKTWVETRYGPKQNPC